ncbi:MAG: 16S rRNA (cytosine(967)-C(5))-methyltransferase RsmB [Clostridia bacterium]|nr:16S rRNA (cytosine(967)-C(5))-methyltransferase RsmB [Clostridia bacterium]
MADNPRRAAADILFKVYRSGAYLNEELNNLRTGGRLTDVDMRFVNELTSGVLKHKLRIDYVISANSTVKVKKIAPYILALLECAVYQIMFMDRVPDSAAVNEAVKLTKTKNLHRSSGFVNGVLRGVTANINSIEYPKERAEYLSVYYSYPLWLVEHWMSEFGVERAESLIKSFDGRAELLLRCNTLRTTAPQLAEALNAGGCSARVYSHDKCSMDYLVAVDGINHIQNLDCYRDGWFYVQDFAAALTVEAMDVEPGMVVMDMCSAPGGKATHMAEKMKNKGKIYSFDVHNHKIDTINQNACRLGIDIIEAQCGDSSKLDKKYIGIADRVLVDAPCSGLGILRRKPDIKYSRRSEDLHQLADIGYSILDNAKNYVKTGGIIVYSTCTIEKCENDDVTNKFLQNNKNFEKVQIDVYDKPNGGSITLYPDTDGCDGFYICKMRKITDR